MKTRLRVLRAERENGRRADLAERVHVPSLSLVFKIAKLFAKSIEEVFLPDGLERVSK